MRAIMPYFLTSRLVPKQEQWETGISYCLRLFSTLSLNYDWLVSSSFAGVLCACVSFQSALLAVCMGPNFQYLFNLH